MFLFQLCTSGDSYLEYYLSLEGDADYGENIVAKTRREAAKLHGLILHHYGKLRAIRDQPCVVQVDEDNSSRQSSRTWFAGDRI